jgi:alpha-beta hydrolase superfamily lysophospholipase
MRMQRLVFTVSITGISRVLVLRDRLLGRIGRGRCEDTPDALASRHSIPSGSNILDAVLVKPAAQPVQAVVLICHGIGEIVEHWLPVQRLLAENGAASLVFDYSGYGRSTGFVEAMQCEQDAISAFLCLQGLMPSHPITLLGFSLGSGVAAGIVNRVAANRLVLCAAFTSFRAAACSICVPRRLAFVLAPIWNAKEALRDCAVPVLIVHGEKDRLLSVQMAVELAAFCGFDAELIVVPGLVHNEPYSRPRLSYWGLILSRLGLEEQGALRSAIHLN